MAENANFKMSHEKVQGTAETDRENEIFTQVANMSYGLYKEANLQALAHLYAANYWGGSYLFLGIAITTLSAAVSASIFSESGYFAVVGGFISLLLVIISALSTFLNPDQRTNLHHKAYTHYLGLSGRAKAFYSIDLKLRKKTIEELCLVYQDLAKELEELRNSSPRLPIRHIDRAIKDWKPE